MAEARRRDLWQVVLYERTTLGKYRFSAGSMRRGTYDRFAHDCGFFGRSECIRLILSTTPWIDCAADWN